MGKKIKDKIILDDEDKSLLDEKWYLSHGYISRQIKIGGEQYQQRIHREVLGLTKGDKVQVDHINGNKYDNRKSNLRLCTQSENKKNKGKYRTNKSGLKGVSYKKSNEKYCSQITVDGKTIHIGLFDDKENAAYVYDQFAKSLHGEFARTNVV